MDLGRPLSESFTTESRCGKGEVKWAGRGLMCATFYTGAEVFVLEVMTIRVCFA